MSKKNKNKGLLKQAMNMILNDSKRSYVGRVSDLIAEKSEKYFAGNESAVRPRAELIQVNLQRQNRIFLDLTVKFDYGYIVGTRTVQYSEQYSQGVEISLVYVYKTLLAIVDRITTRAVDGIFDKMPVNYLRPDLTVSSFPPGFSIAKHRESYTEVEGTPIENIFNDVQLNVLPNLISDAERNIRNTVEKKKSSYTDLPAGYILGDISALDWSFNMDDELGVDCQVTAKINASRMYTQTYKCRVLASECLTCKTVKQVSDILEGMFRSVIDEAEKYVVDRIVVCSVSLNTADCGIPTVLFKILSEGEIEIDNIKACFRDFPRFPKAQFVLEYRGANRYAIVPMQITRSTKIQEFSFSDKEFRDTINVPYILSRHKKLPASTTEMLRYLRALAQLSESESKKRKLGAPDITITCMSGGIMSIQCHKLKLSGASLFGDSTRNFKETALDVLDQCFEEQKAFENLRKRQLSVLATLNKTEIALLKHVLLEKRTWFHNAADQIEYRTVTTKQYTGDCLSALCEKTFPTEDGDKPFLVWRWEESRKHGPFRLYTPNVTLDMELLDSIVPREYEGDEIGNIRASKRDEWFADLAAKADTPEKKWTALRLLENDLPKSFLPAFVNTDKGRQFFQSFTGADAVYVRFLLSSTPGCKRIAESLFPEG